MAVDATVPEGLTERDAIISGIGISRIGRRTGIPGLELTLEAARAALADAGIDERDLTGITSIGDTPVDEVAAALDVDPSYGSMGFTTGGLLNPVMDACLAVSAGRARHVLVYRTVQMLGGDVVNSGNGQGGGDAGKGDLARVMGPMLPLLSAHAYSAANWLAMNCRRHMHEFGTTKEQLGWLAINTRRNAALNPLAVMRDPITMDDYLTARPVSTPFGLLDCDLPVDGAIAFVVSTAAHAGALDHPAVRVNAIGGARGQGGWVDRPDYPAQASVDAAAEMWSRTDLRPSDVGTAQLYDGFTFLTFAWLEALGLCEVGGAGPFVEGATRIALDGELPLNTYGGQLSAGRMHGYWILHEACVQLRSEGGARQIAKQPEVAVVANGGGPIAGCMLLTR
ncbi:MAG: thiolase family protein [Acidimicrobiia bacterium]